MKYAKELEQSVYGLPPSLQIACVSYKAWKKKCKCLQSFTQHIHDLVQECNNVENVFKRLYISATSKPKPHGLCWKHEKCPPSVALAFAKINARTIYKICKRMSKKTMDMSYMSWLTTTRSLCRYEFLCGRKLTHLKKVLGDLTVECPICLEQIPDKHMLILTCGHYACLECMLQHTGMAHRYGTWFNLLANAQRSDCRVCRSMLHMGSSLLI